ncbi:MAG: hypothetical protein JNL70_11285 [Saprospiraceae bacterium]|nr:hypothetical protein [Saprospiraceae bacterium]
MNFINFLRLVSRNWLLLSLSMLTAAAVTFHLTRDTPKEYQSHTVINTGLVSGYNIESSNGGRIDYAYTNNEMENILGIARSRETQEEVLARLLAQALIQTAPSVEIISAAAFEDLKKDINSTVRTQIVDNQSFETTLNNIKAWRDNPEDNNIKAILSGKHPLWGIEHLQEMVIKREGNSDMVRFSYTSTDPSVCRNTIKILTDIFFQKYRANKEGQTSDVLAFFENATQESAATLNGKEDNMLNFMVNNKIINYYEQTRFIAAKKEDLDELYFKEMMRLAAADSARRNLEAQIGSRINLPKINQNLARQRNQLAQASSRAAALEIGSLEDTTAQIDTRQLNQINTQIEYLRKEMRHNADATFAVERTPEGIDTKNVLAQWLTQWIDVEQGLARLNVFRERKSEFDRIYSRFAPWGSKIKRLEREIDVAERAYLENLHSYNQARLHKFNMMLSGNLRVVDAPFFPDKPKPSKRAMLIIVAGLAGLILPLALMIALELLDKSLRDPENAAATTGLALFAAFPKLPKNWMQHNRVNFPLIVERSVEQLLQHLKIDLKLHSKNVVARLAFLSPNSGDGKTMIASATVQKLRSYGYRVLFLRPDNLSEGTTHEDDLFYKADFTLFEKEDELDLIDNQNIGWHRCQYIVTEIPAIGSGNFPAKLLSQVDVTLLVCRANRTWSNADRRALATVNQFLKRPARLILNATRLDLLEDSLGELPRKRSVLRRWVKRLARRNWTTE